MSGGVDSSVAAYLLKQQGYDVVGITMQIWPEEDVCTVSENGGCCGLSAAEDAGRVAAMLDIPHYVLNFRKEFQDRVIDYFMEEYMHGRTPNPCIACNRHVKWEAMLHRVTGLGCDYLATGHYARVCRLENGRYTLRTSASEGKDQTYALYSLTQEQLARTLMPAGEYDKKEIRQIALDIGLPVADKPDSQEICFIPDHDYAGYIERQSGKQFPAGHFVDRSGTVLGMHKGIIHYTVGQRKGLGLSLGKPAFVVEIRAKTNEVVIGSNEDTFHSGLIADGLNLMSIPELEGERRVNAKIRYSHKGASCVIRRTGTDQVECRFEEPVRAITPGQAVVFYEGEYMLGGAVISEVFC